MRLGRAQRREQILRAAAATFVTGGGFAATSLEDIASAAGVTRMILYRHFESKSALYQATLERAATQLHEATTEQGELHADSIAAMLHWARTEPAEFRLLFHQAAREPEFRADVDRLRGSMADAVRPHIPHSTGPWGQWGAQLATTVTIEAIMCWLDSGCPDPDEAAERISRVLEGVYAAAAPRRG